MTFQGVRYSLFAFGSGRGFADFDAIDVREPESARADDPDPVPDTRSSWRPRDRPRNAAAPLAGGHGDTVQVGAGAGTRFTVLDRGLGRVALRSERGLVSVGADGTLSLRAGTPGEAETFQWIETFTGELTLLSLATQRYVRLDADAACSAPTREARTPTGATASGGRGPGRRISPCPAPTPTRASRTSSCSRSGRRDGSTSTSSATRSRGAGARPTIRTSSPTGRRSSSAGTPATSAGAPTAPSTSSGGCENGELDGVIPKVIVILAGTNNVGDVPAAPGKAAEKVADITNGLQAIVDAVPPQGAARDDHAERDLPRNDNMAVMPEIDAINAELAKLADGQTVRFLNVNDKLADAQGTLFEGMTVDKLHLTLKGYQVWADGLKPILTECSARVRQRISRRRPPAIRVRARGPRRSRDARRRRPMTRTSAAATSVAMVA